MNTDVLLSIFKSGALFDFSLLKDGNMKVNGEGASQNRKIFIRSNFSRYVASRTARVNHGTDVVIVGKSDRRTSLEADALLTNDPKMAIATTFADCFPVLLFDSKARVIGIIHCSYKTILGGIIAKTVLIAAKLKAYPENILAVIGPGICKNCYEVKEDISYRYEGYEEFLIRKDDRIFVDLHGLIMRKMDEARIPTNRVFSFEEKCTCCYRENGEPVYFSARREKMRPPHIKAGLAAICLER